ncbi:zinc finger CCHC domain-containing protein 8 isoform X1 [Octopus vulgaris]|uniref:Zinc finger CCHC domain-containing protein 8 isoform X1 n=1 Tax=Octopus vulgaris TaxID=6645 RepID=A0AA36AGQ6_OCTVU|nr:zinc finger CCHC domain-containing protein 8 isoform X1 [Octopus vulgaris]
MASSFGDSSLFEEFERDRSSASTFISYNQNEYGSEDRSKIIFRFEESDSSSSSELDSKSSGEAAEVSDDSEEEDSEDKDSNDQTNEDGDDIITDKRTEDVAAEGKSEKQSKKRKKRNGEMLVGMMKHTNHQLQFERDKLRKFAKKIDSTRCVPDEESPGLQIIYQNNAFSRKYRSEIEDFINHLIFRHQRERYEKLPDLNLKASSLTCVDLNDELDSEQRGHNMWCNHAIIGTSQFYNNFMIDTSGWPLVNFEPSLTDSWEIPKYEQVFFEALPIDLEEGDVPKESKPERRKPQCFNCGGAHMIRDCKEKRDAARIQMNRQNFMQNSQSNNPKTSRYHAETDPRFSSFKPGYLSDSLREAMRLGPSTVPIHIYRMRFYGYPPGWLQEAKTKTASGMSLFDKHGKQVGVAGDTLEDGEVEQTTTGDDEIDPNLIIEYPGFTVPLPESFRDEHYKYNLPPIQEHQLKTVLHSSQQDDAKKRKHGTGKDGNPKRHRSFDTSSDMDIDTEESFPYYEDLGTCRLTETNCFIPPLPSDTPPSKPPLPSDTPPSSSSDSKYSPKNQPSRQSPVTEVTSKRKPLCLPKPKSDAALSSDSLEDLEAQYRCLQKQLQEEDSDSQPSSESQIKASESNSIVLSSDESSNSQAASDGFASLSSPSMCQSLGKDYGTPVNQNKGPFPTLPDRTNFSVGIQDHIPFENLPQSTGTYNRMRQVFQKIKSRNKS